MQLIRKSTKFVLIAVISLALIALPFYVRQIKAASEQKYEFSQYSMVSAKQNVYHRIMNGHFNKRIRALINDEGSKEIVNDKKNCEDNNITTFCVASEAFDMFDQYRKELIAELDNVNEELDLARQSIEEGSLKLFYQGPLIGYNTEKKADIENELIKAEKALDLTIKAYNEMQIAYPLHLEYQETINNLEKYRIHLESIESYTESYPKLFVNATTTECT